MYQKLVEGLEVPWSLLVKDLPEDKHQDIDFIIDQLDWEKIVDPNFKDSHYLEPVTSEKGEGDHDNWIVYGKVDDFQYFTAKDGVTYENTSATEPPVPLRYSAPNSIRTPRRWAPARRPEPDQPQLGQLPEIPSAQQRGRDARNLVTSCLSTHDAP